MTREEYNKEMKCYLDTIINPSNDSWQDPFSRADFPFQYDERVGKVKNVNEGYYVDII